MNVTLQEIATLLLGLGAMSLGGVSIEHFIENFIVAHVNNKQVKTALPYVFGYIFTLLTNLAGGGQLLDAVTQGHTVVGVFLTGVMAQIFHKTWVGATPVPSTVAPTSVPTKATAFLLVALLGLGAGLHADGTELIATINPSASGTMFLVDRSGNLVKNNASLYGADLVVGLVSVSGTVASPTLFAGFGGGVVQDADIQSTRMYGKVMVGYWLFNAFASYDGINTRIGAGVTAPLTLLTGTYKILKTNF